MLGASKTGVTGSGSSSQAVRINRPRTNNPNIFFMIYNLLLIKKFKPKVLVVFKYDMMIILSRYYKKIYFMLILSYLYIVKIDSRLF